jgi:hypothetical protein
LIDVLAVAVIDDGKGKRAYLFDVWFSLALLCKKQEAETVLSHCTICRIAHFAEEYSNIRPS